MQDRQLYEQILGIRSPWYVDRVELKLDKTPGAVRVYLNHQADAFVAMTDATVTRVEHTEQVSFVAVNKAQIVRVIEAVEAD